MNRPSLFMFDKFACSVISIQGMVDNYKMRVQVRHVKTDAPKKDTGLNRSKP